MNRLLNIKEILDIIIGVLTIISILINLSNIPNEPDLIYGKGNYPISGQKQRLVFKGLL